MCGIGGVIATSPSEMNGIDGGALVAALRHRGPDRQAAASPWPGVWLAAARLAIRDLSAAGDQPMSTLDGKLTVVHNGEIYNATKLRRDLEARGHRFGSRCDTEALLHGYREWGDDVVERLDGMFAFALWDEARRRLLLARDPLGVKPLWLARSSRRVAFASEVRALLAAGAVTRSIDRVAVARFLSTGSVSEPDALVRGVEALAPGCRHVVHIEDDNGFRLVEKTTRYFHLPPDEPERVTLVEAAARVRERLAASVAGCLESDVPVALLLSGGLDSSALGLLAHGLPGRGAAAPLCTFHVRTSNEGADRARILAEQLHLPHHEVSLVAAPERLMAALAAQDQPSVDGVNVYLIAAAIREAGLKVALTGLGADELFLGYPMQRNYVRARRLQLETSMQSAIAQRLVRAASIPLRALAGRAGRAAAADSSFAPWRIEKLLDVAAASGATSTYSAVRALFPSSSVRRLMTGTFIAESPGSEAVAGARSAASEVSRLDLGGYLVNTLLRDADVMSMAHGVELRVPFVERRLVETVLRAGVALPPSRGPKKPLLCAAVPELPIELRTAAKEGFVLPFEAWLGGPLQASTRELLLGGAAALRVGLSPDATSHVWERFRRRPDGASAHRVWALVALVQWAETHGATA